MARSMFAANSPAATSARRLYPTDGLSAPDQHAIVSTRLLSCAVAPEFDMQAKATVHG